MTSTVCLRLYFKWYNSILTTSFYLLFSHHLIMWYQIIEKIMIIKRIVNKKMINSISWLDKYILLGTIIKKKVKQIIHDTRFK